MMAFKSFKHWPLALLACLALPVHAERPMTVDDAGATEPGAAKIEFGWSRDDRVRGWDLVAGYAPMSNLEVEVVAQGLQQSHRASQPEALSRMRAKGLALKWVPLAGESGLSAGIKFELLQARQHFHDDAAAQSESTRALTGLATWRFENGPAAHFNLGRKGCVAVGHATPSTPGGWATNTP